MCSSDLSVSYVDGKWVRFQYSRPRKIGGYNGSFLDASGISRGMIMSAVDGINYVISGWSDGVERWTTDNDDAVGAGPVAIEPIGGVLTVTITDQGSAYTNGTYTNVPLNAVDGSGALATVVVSSNLVFSVEVTAGGADYVHNEEITIDPADIGGTGSGFSGYVDSLDTYSPNANTLWQFDIGYDALGDGENNLIAHPGQNLNDISSTTNTRPMYGLFTGETLQPVGVFTASGTINGTTTMTFATTYAAMGAGMTVTGTDIPAGTTIVSALEVGGTWTVTLSQAATGSGTYEIGRAHV